jgi:DNA-binding YbaB/EbfC family protein
MDMFNLLRQAQGLKEKMSQFQKELESQSFTGSSGGVTVTLNGKHEVQKVSVEPQALESGAGKLQDSIQSAVNEAGHQVNAKLKAEMGKMTGGLGLPGLF